MLTLSKMRVSVVLLLLAARCDAICFPFLQSSETVSFNRQVGAMARWNRAGKIIELIEALSPNGTAMCSVHSADSLEGKKIIVSGMHKPPYVIGNADGTITGYMGDVWTAVEKELKFTSVNRMCHPAEKPNFAVMERGEVQAWLSAAFVDGFSTGYYVHSEQLGQIKYSLFLRREETRIERFWYVKIFSHGLWATSFGFVVGIAGLLLVMYRIKRAACHSYVECNDELAVPSYNFLNVLGVVTGQGFQGIPTSWSLRLLIMSAVAMGMLISCGFSSTLTSHLAINDKFTPTINNLEDVFEKKTHSLCFRNSTRAHDRVRKFLINHPEYNTTDFRTMGPKKCPDLTNRVEYVSNICEFGFVFLEAGDVFRSVHDEVEQDCDIAELDGENWSHNLVVLHAKSSPYRRLIDEAIRRLRRSGIMRHLERKWLKKPDLRGSKKEWTYQPVDYGHIKLFGIALLIMMVVSGFICVLEIIWYKFWHFNALIVCRDRRSDFFTKIPYEFRSNELDAASKRAWAINA